MTLAIHSGEAVKNSEFRRFLKQQGVEMREGKRHTKLYHNGKQSVIGRHLGEEINEITRQAILKQLGIKE